MAFKQCSCCRKEWATREDFLLSGELILIGYQACFENPGQGLFLFNHISENCGTTISLEVDKFDSLYTGLRYSEVRTGQSVCTGRCLIVTNLELCGAECALTYVREIMRIILNMKKNPIINHIL